MPRSTLKDRVSGSHGNKSGPEPYLSYEEEKELASHLVKCAKIGYPKTKDEQIALFELRYENGYNLFIDRDYVSWLLKKHPDDVPADLLSGVSDSSQSFGDEDLVNEQEGGLDLQDTTGDIPEYASEASVD